MKKNLIKIVTVSTIFAFGLGLISTINSSSDTVYAEQHSANYAAYSYSGNYYSTIDNSLTDGLQGTLRKKLSSLILPKAWYTYSGSSNGQLGKVLQSADEDPSNSSNMVLFYTRDSVTKQGSSNDGWNREHVWPQSLSNDHWGKEKAGTDILHIRPTYVTTNSKRGNLMYGDINKASPQTYNGMVYAYANNARFEPLDSVKGDVARILMYVWTAYYDYYSDTSLSILNTIESYDTLLKWHTMDQPDALEGNRNNFSESSNQKNRNPFVDHPEYAWKIFGGSVSESVKNACKEAYPENSQEVPSHNSSEAPSSSTPQSSIASSAVPSSEPEPSSVIPASEPVTSSQETISSIMCGVTTEPEEISSAPAASENKNNKNRGCGGSIAGTITILSMTSIVGLVLIFSKKKK